MSNGFELPSRLAGFDFKKNSEHPTCNEAEGNYRLLLTKGIFTRRGSLFGFSQAEVARVVYGLVYDPKQISGLDGRHSIAIIKNPCGLRATHEKERIGWHNALIDTDEWMFLAAVDQDHLRITRPINSGGTVRYLRQLKQEAFRRIDRELIESYP